MSFSPRDFRNALGRFPTGIAVITAMDGQGKRIGITVNSFVSVSLDPPLISFNIARTLASFEAISKLDGFNVNLLMDDQREVSNRFAQAGADKWRDVSYHLNDAGHPVITPSMATFHCSRYAIYEAGDHRIVVGRVTALEVDESATPLVFYRGAYSHLRFTEDDSMSSSRVS